MFQYIYIYIYINHQNIATDQKPLKKTRPRLKTFITFVLDSSMAGLQYYFFPTDFFYPRPSSANGDNANKPVLQVQTQKAGAENIERCKIVVHNDVEDNNKLCYQPPASTSCTALVPSTCLIKKEFRRKRSIVANCCNN